MTTAGTLTPLSAGELLDHAIVMARRYFFVLLRPVAPLYLFGCAVALLSRTGSAPVLPYISFLLSLAVSAVGECVAVLAAHDVLHGAVPEALQPWRRVRPVLWPASVGYMIKWVLTIGGLLIIILPGAYLLCIYFAVPTVSLTEGLGVRAARHRSRELARTHLTRIFLTVGLVELGLALSTVIISYSMRHFGISPNSLAITLIGWIIGFGFLPLKASLMVLVYLDCRVRSEGYDLIQQAAALGAA
jgi:hypothetical protein